MMQTDQSQKCEFYKYFIEMPRLLRRYTCNTYIQPVFLTADCNLLPEKSSGIVITVVEFHLKLYETCYTINNLFSVAYTTIFTDCSIREY